MEQTAAPIRSRDLDRTIGDSFQIYIRHFLKCAGAAAITMTRLIVISALLWAAGEFATVRRSCRLTSAQLRCGAMLLLGGLLLAGVPFAGCNRAAEGEYRTLKVDNHIASFSTEYRTYYRLDGPYIVDDRAHTFTCVEFLAPKKTMREPNPIPGDGAATVDMEYVPAAITISAADADTYSWRPVEVRIQEILDSESYWPHFRVLERSTVTVAGVQAELIAYESDGFFVGPPIWYYFRLSFDRNGLLWDLYGKCEPEMAESVRADFDHLAETLSIVD